MTSIFITGTNTGAGKTVLTALLLNHLRRTNPRALAMKPFCSGGTGDVRLLQSLQLGQLSRAEMNPFYFSQPVAPLAGALSEGRVVRLGEVLRKIKTSAAKAEVLLIEGAGGLLVPLGEKFTALDLIIQLDCNVIIAARNQLGVINHTLLTVRALNAAGIPMKRIRVALMGVARPDVSAATNQEMIAEWVRPTRVVEIPYLGRDAKRVAAIRSAAERIATKLELLIG